jgi:hypothetical protein
MAKAISLRQKRWLKDSKNVGGVLNCSDSGAFFLTAMGADKSQIESSFCEGIHIAKQQKSIPLMKRAEATCAEYCRKKASGSGGHGCRLPLW